MVLLQCRCWESLHKSNKYLRNLFSHRALLHSFTHLSCNTQHMPRCPKSDPCMILCSQCHRHSTVHYRDKSYRPSSMKMPQRLDYKVHLSKWSVDLESNMSVLPRGLRREWQPEGHG